MVKDLIAARLEADGQILFEVSDVVLAGVDTMHPEVSFISQSRRPTLQCGLHRRM